MFEINDRVVLTTDMFGEHLPKGSYGVIVRFPIPGNNGQFVARFPDSRYGNSDFLLFADEVSKIKENPQTLRIPLHRKSGVRFTVRVKG